MSIETEHIIDDSYDWTPQTAPETVQLTVAQVRKLARLTALHSPDAIVQVEEYGDSETSYLQVEWLDEYGHHVRTGLNGGRPAGYAAVIRENGWSNPSVASTRRQLSEGS